MKIFCYDDDPRLKSEGLEAYSKNSGSFAVITNNLNKELKRLKLLGTEEETDVVGFASGLRWDFGFPDKHRFLINVWETNVLPALLVQLRKRLEGDKYKVFGLSEQISQVWRDYGFPTETIDIGCDTDFWAPQTNISKPDKFTIISTVSCNFRSGITHLLQAFDMASEFDNDMRLIVKNTDSRAEKVPLLIKALKLHGKDVEYICERHDIYKIRELMAKSHLMVYPVINTSAGLPILEASAMELPVMVGDFCPVNLYPVCETVSCESYPISELKQTLVSLAGLPYTFPEGWIDETKAEMHWPNIVEMSKKILKVKKDYDIYKKKAIACRKEVLNRWTWKHSCEQLLKNIKI